MILSPQVFFMSEEDSFTESATPLFSRMRTGTTKKVARPQAILITEVAIRPSDPGPPFDDVQDDTVSSRDEFPCKNGGKVP
jgi:hypothetical protein